MKSSEVYTLVKSGIRDFFCRLKKRKITIAAYDLDCGCTGYAHIWNAEGTDYEYIDIVDLSCLEALKDGKSGPYDNGDMPKSSEKYKHCNHHHEVTENHELVDFGRGEFVANKKAVPLLKALNELGLRTRTHHYNGGDHGFVSILLFDGITVEFKTVNEIHSSRNDYNGLKEMLISWRKVD